MTQKKTGPATKNGTNKNNVLHGWSLRDAFFIVAAACVGWGTNIWLEKKMHEYQSNHHQIIDLPEPPVDTMHVDSASLHKIGPKPRAL